MKTGLESTCILGTGRLLAVVALLGIAPMASAADSVLTGVVEATVSDDFMEDRAHEAYWLIDETTGKPYRLRFTGQSKRRRVDRDSRVLVVLAAAAA